MTEKPDAKKCPTCSTPLRVLMFMGEQVDGYVCDPCSTWFHPDSLEPLAVVL